MLPLGKPAPIRASVVFIILAMVSLSPNSFGDNSSLASGHSTSPGWTSISWVSSTGDFVLEIDRLGASGFNMMDLYDATGSHIGSWRSWAGIGYTGAQVFAGEGNSTATVTTPLFRSSPSANEFTVHVHGGAGNYSAILWAGGKLDAWQYYLNDSTGSVVGSASGDRTFIVHAEDFQAGTRASVASIPGQVSVGAAASYSFNVTHHLLLETNEQFRLVTNVTTGVATLETQSRHMDCPCRVTNMLGPALNGEQYWLNWTGVQRVLADSIAFGADAYLPGRP